MKITRIGEITRGGTFDGADVYYLLQTEESDSWADDGNAQHRVVDSFRESVCFDNGPGQSFCTDTTVEPFDRALGRFIGVAHIRWDV